MIQLEYDMMNVVRGLKGVEQVCTGNKSNRLASLEYDRKGLISGAKENERWRCFWMFSVSAQ